MEGIYLGFYENSSVVSQIQVNKSNVEDSTSEFTFTIKKAFDLNDDVQGDKGYKTGADITVNYG